MKNLSIPVFAILVTFLIMTGETSASSLTEMDPIDWAIQSMGSISQ